MSGKIPTALGLTGGIASAWPRLTTLVFQGRGHFFMYIPYSRLAEASSKQAWQDHLRTLTYPNVLHCPAVDPPNLRRGFLLLQTVQVKTSEARNARPDLTASEILATVRRLQQS